MIYVPRRQCAAQYEVISGERGFLRCKPFAPAGCFQGFISCSIHPGEFILRSDHTKSRVLELTLFIRVVAIIMMAHDGGMARSFFSLEPFMALRKYLFGTVDAQNNIHSFLITVHPL